MTRLMKTLVLAMLCSGLAALPATAQTPSQLQAQITALQAQITALQNAIPDCMTTASGAGSVDDVIFTGCNVHVQNGQGSTASSNNVGNLIIGYNESSGSPARGASHNVVIGPYHSYSSYGGLVAGYRNKVSGAYASVSGGKLNEASSHYASVSGGEVNTASGFAASVSGGKYNEATDRWASVSGGQYNEASGGHASAGGDTTNTSAIAALPALSACMDIVSVSGQDVDDVVFSGCNVHVQNGSGSTNNSNGVGNLIIGYNEDDVLVGDGHSTYGDNDRGGSHHVVIGPEHSYSSYGGLVAGIANTVSDEYASVSGGQSNTASGYSASVSGGFANTASGSSASVSGGHTNEANANTASVSGGRDNEASDVAASVNGGYGNEASGDYGSVSGGLNRTASGIYDWRAGTLFETD